MNAISSVGQASSSSSGRDAYSALNSQQFIKIMFAELSRQDPLKPNDSNETLKQLASIRSIQSDLELQTKLGSLVGQNELASAGGLIGKTIVGLNGGFDRVHGIVESVIRTSDGPVLRLQSGHFVPYENLEQIIETPPPPPPPPPVTPPTPPVTPNP